MIGGDLLFTFMCAIRKSVNKRPAAATAATTTSICIHAHMHTYRSHKYNNNCYKCAPAYIQMHKCTNALIQMPHSLSVAVKIDVVAATAILAAIRTLIRETQLWLYDKLPSLAAAATATATAVAIVTI